MYSLVFMCAKHRIQGLTNNIIHHQGIETYDTPPALSINNFPPCKDKLLLINFDLFHFVLNQCMISGNFHINILLCSSQPSAAPPASNNWVTFD